MRKMLRLFLMAMALFGFAASANAQTSTGKPYYGYYYAPDASIGLRDSVQAEALVAMRSFNITSQWKPGQTVGLCDDNNCVVFAYNANGNWTLYTLPFPNPHNIAYKNIVGAVLMLPPNPANSYVTTVVFYTTQWVTGTVTITNITGGNPALPENQPGAGNSGDAVVPSGATIGGGSGGGDGGSGGGGEGGCAVKAPTKSGAKPECAPGDGGGDGDAVHAH